MDCEALLIDGGILFFVCALHWRVCFRSLLRSALEAILHVFTTIGVKAICILSVGTVRESNASRRRRVRETLIDTWDLLSDDTNIDYGRWVTSGSVELSAGVSEVEHRW